MYNFIIRIINLARIYYLSHYISFNRCQHLMYMLPDYANHLNVIGVTHYYETTSYCSNYCLVFLFMLIGKNIKQSKAILRILDDS